MTLLKHSLSDSEMELVFSCMDSHGYITPEQVRHHSTLFRRACAFSCIAVCSAQQANCSLVQCRQTLLCNITVTTVACRPSLRTTLRVAHNIVAASSCPALPCSLSA
jgi:hypothetical protein